MISGRIVAWSKRASDDLDGIVEFIAEDNEIAANEFYKYVIDIVNDTAHRPIGRRGEVPDTYERVLTRYSSYLIIYTWDDSTLNVIRIFHTSQKNKI